MKTAFLHKLFHWEYWPTYMLYYPNIPFALYHAIKARNLVFYTAVNPSIKNSGIGTESKYCTLQLVPKKYVPKSVLHTNNTTIKETLLKIKTQNISYPVIVKPDVGFRGLLVKKVNSEHDLINHLKKYPIAIIVQEFLTEKNECGIFYHRLPNNSKGKITSITLKEFLSVTGDGEKDLESLIRTDKRAKLYLNLIKKHTSIPLNTVIKEKQKIQLSVIGNHSKGTRFLNGNHLISNRLEETINNLNKNIKGWFYGRLDIKYNTFKDLESGNFKILELNGILAEPTHIYDVSKTSYLQALKTIRTHWKHLYKIARINHDEKLIPYRPAKEFLKDIVALKKYTKCITSLHHKI